MREMLFTCEELDPRMVESDFALGLPEEGETQTTVTKLYSQAVEYEQKLFRFYDSMKVRTMR